MGKKVIITKKKLKEERKKRKQHIIFGIIIITLMAVSVLSVTTTTQKHYYNGFKFVQDEKGYWHLKLNRKDLVFNYLPEDLEDIDLIRSDLSDNLIITFDSSFNEYDLRTLDSLRFDLYNSLNGYNNILLSYGIADESLKDIYKSLPIITCENASSIYTIIYLTRGNFNISNNNNNCIKINYKRNEEILAIKDKIIYLMIGVME